MRKTSEGSNSTRGRTRESKGRRVTRRVAVASSLDVKSANLRDSSTLRLSSLVSSNVPMAHQQPSLPRRRQVRVVLSTTALLSFMSVRKATALALAELGIRAFFVAGAAQADLGAWGPWFVLGAALFGLLVRAADIESWALFIPGGAVGRAEQAFGPRVALYNCGCRPRRTAVARRARGRRHRAFIRGVERSHRDERPFRPPAGRRTRRTCCGHRPRRSVASCADGLELPSDMVARGVWVAVAGWPPSSSGGPSTPAGTEPSQSLLTLPLPSTSAGWSSLVAAIPAGFCRHGDGAAGHWRRRRALARRA